MNVMMNMWRSALLLVGFGLVLAACGAEEPAGAGWSVDEGAGGETEYGSDTTVVTTPGSTDTNIIVTGDPDECVDIEGECVDLDEAKKNGGQHCQDPDAQADIIVVDGEVVDVVCYPPKNDGTDIHEVDRDEDGNAEVPQTDNGAVVTFGEDTDENPIEGDISLTAERTTIYGNGVDKTIIDGNISVSSNNSRIRGLTVTGDVTYDDISNGSAISFCKIYGDLEVVSRGFSATNCQIFGSVDIDGQNATLMNIGVQGQWDVHESADCFGCYSFDDANDDYDVAEDEVGEELTCDGAPEGDPAPTNNGAPDVGDGSSGTGG